MKLAPGGHLIAMELVTGANFGQEGAGAACDRPVAMDAWNNLPYLPGTALKGVIAERSGGARPRKFGTADRQGEDSYEQGKPSPLIFGDGLLACFPLHLRGGRVATIFCSSTLAQLGRTEHRFQACIPDFSQSDFAGDVSPAEMAIVLRAFRGEIDTSPLRALLIDRGIGPFVVASSALERELCRRSIEDRTQTAIEGGLKRVKSGSLRVVQLVPPGSIFVSLVTNASNSEIDLPCLDHLQAGSWEGSGAGFLRAYRVVVPSPSDVTNQYRPKIESGENPVPAHRIMTTVFETVRDIDAGSERAAKIRTVVRQLGPRLKYQGEAKTVAFCLAKAQPLRPTPPSPDRFAYLWVLRQLLPQAESLDGEALVQCAIPVISGEVSLPIQSYEKWLWLQRFCDVLLRKEPAAQESAI